MNERYEQLLAQAHIEFAPDSKAVTKRFAELIVKECAEIAYKTSWDDLVHGYGQAVIPLHLHNTIKQHFGVEE